MCFYAICDETAGSQLAQSLETGRKGSLTMSVDSVSFGQSWFPPFLREKGTGTKERKKSLQLTEFQNVPSSHFSTGLVHLCPNSQTIQNTWLDNVSPTDTLRSQCPMRSLRSVSGTSFKANLKPSNVPRVTKTSSGG